MRSILVMLCMTTYALHAQLAGTSSGAMQYPNALPLWKTRLSAGMALGKVPKDIVEEMDTFRWPLLEVDAFIGLPENFMVEGTLNTQVITNHLRVGPKWVWMPTDRFHGMVGFDFAYMFGSMKSGAFNNTVSATFLYPNASVGYQFDKVAITVKGELNILTSYQLSAEDIVTGETNNMFNGGSVALYIEQPLWKDQYVLLGFKQNFLKFYYPSWLLFPTFDRYYWVPEFVIGFRL